MQWRVQSLWPEIKKRSPAVLWYPGKTLYESAKGAVGVESEYEEENAPDYDNAAAKLAARKSRPTTAQQVAGKSKQGAVAGTGKVVGEFGPISEPDRAAFLAGRSTSTTHNLALSAQRIEQIPRLENWRPDSARHLLASTIAIIPNLIAAGKVAHDVMTAIKSGSAGDDCASLSISTALATARYAWHVDLSGVRTPAGSIVR